MTTDEGSDGDGSAAVDDEPSDPPSKERSDSRFDKFHDRLDERDSESDRSEGDRDDSESKADEPTKEPDSAVESPAEPADTSDDEQTEGWRWGAQQSDRDEDHEPAGGEPDRDTGIDRSSDTDPQSVDDPSPAPENRSTPSGPGGDRIWNRMAGGEDESETSSKVSEVGSKTTSESHPAERDEHDETSMGPIETEGIETAPKKEEIPEDRWAKLGSGMGADEARASTTDPGAETEQDPPSEDESPDIESDTEDMAWPDEGKSGEDTDSGQQPQSGSGSIGESQWDALDRATSAGSTLVLGPTGRSLSNTICSRFLTGSEESRDVLFVTFDESPDDRIEICHRADEWAGGEIGVVEVGRGSRNATTSEITSETAAGSITVRHVSKPGDLSKLGIVITQLLSQFDNNARQTVVCFHTLSALHAQIGTKTLFRFLNTLQGRLRSSNALAHYHMDPDLHDEIVIETLRPVFDSVVRFSTDGELSVE